MKISELGQFNLITAFEVFEHIPNVKQLMRDLSVLLTNDGIILFSTLLSDNEIKFQKRLTWWYASPRNGHISLFSHKRLSLLCTEYDFKLGSFSSGFHVMWRNLPKWAEHFIKIT